MMQPWKQLTGYAKKCLTPQPLDPKWLPLLHEKGCHASGSDGLVQYVNSAPKTKFRPGEWTNVPT
ncbi:MAG: hypothetical protein ACRDD1_19190, partial [Planctomycetia bacterium]